MGYNFSSLRPRSSPTAAELALKAQEQRIYVRQFWIFLASVIAILALFHWTSVALCALRRPHVARRPTSEKEKYEPEVEKRPRMERRSWRNVPAAVSSAFRIVAFRWTVPIGFRAVSSVSELTFIIVYIVSLLLWLLLNTRDLTTLYWEDRSAHLASSNLALVVALAGKNNIISFLTGVSHEKLNVLHRAAARTCLILLWMHAIAHVASGLPEKFDFTHDWMIFGAIGLTAFTMATVLSIRPIRQMAFEFFLVTHIILVAIFLIFGVMHTRAVEFDDYIWPALIIWAFDRILRLGRVVINGQVWAGFSKPSCLATVELLSKDTVRLTLRRKMSWKPGQHAYVILPSVSSLPTEAHPFTIASIPENMDGTSSGKEKDVVFIIRGREGFTGRLMQHAEKNRVCVVPALVDGPYGCPPDLKQFSTCVLIAGGSGVSYTLPLLLETIRLAAAQKSSTRRVVFVWAIRDHSHIQWISTLLSQALGYCPPTLSVEISIYFTGRRNTLQLPTIFSRETSANTVLSVDGEYSTEKLDGKVELPLYDAVKTVYGRPDIQKILADEIGIAEGPVSVDVAGPSALSHTVRTALRSDIAGPLGVLKGAPSVTLHVETFGMVKA